MRSRSFAWFLLKIILPMYVATEILKLTGILEKVAEYLAPVMGVWGLPGEAAAVLAAGYLVGIYAGAAVTASLNLTAAQITVLGVIVGISHSLLVEGALLRQLLPGSFYRITIMRIVLSLAAGWVMSWMLK